MRHISEAVKHMITFLVLLFKMIIFPGFYFIFSKFQFFEVVSGVKGQKNGPRRQKGLPVMLHISGNICHMIFIYCTHV